MNRLCYKAVNGRVVHKKRCCKLKQYKSNIEVYDKETVNNNLCKICFGTCFICMENKGWNSCSQHSICDECLKLYLTNTSTSKIICPCGENLIDPRSFSKECFDLWMLKHTNNFEIYSTKNVNLNEFENLLTEKCPSCNTAFFDFDGCLALNCACTANFCAFCFMIFEDSESCHKHVTECYWNSSKDLFCSISTWKKIRNIIRLKNKIKFYTKLLFYEGYMEFIYILSNTCVYNTIFENIMFYAISVVIMLPFILCYICKKLCMGVYYNLF